MCKGLLGVQGYAGCAKGPQVCKGIARIGRGIAKECNMCRGMQGVHIRRYEGCARKLQRQAKVVREDAGRARRGKGLTRRCKVCRGIFRIGKGITRRCKACKGIARFGKGITMGCRVCKRIQGVKGNCKD